MTKKTMENSNIDKNREEEIDIGAYFFAKRDLPYDTLCWEYSRKRMVLERGKEKSLKMRFERKLTNNIFVLVLTKYFIG